MKPIIVITLLMLSLPAFYGIRQVIRNMRGKKIQLALAIAYDQMILNNKLAIEHSEVLGNRALGLDRKNKKLLMIDHNGTDRQEICIPLNTISTTRIIEEKNSKGIVQKVLLELKHKRTDACYCLCFFDKSSDPITDYSFFSRRALQWRNRIDVHKYPGAVKLEQELVL